MTSGRARQTLTFSLLLAAVVFGVVISGGLDWTAPGAAAPEPTASAASAASATPSAASPSVTGPTSYLPSFADLAEKVLPAVVSIDAQTIEKDDPRRQMQGNPFEFFFGPQGPQRSPGGDDGRPQEFRSDAGGSGFVISADGYIVTNNHVIEGSTKIRVRLDDRLYDAEIKGADPATDLALLKIDAGKSLPYLPLGDSDKLRVGDYVMAIGNPLLLDHTVTVGVVSAKGRSIGLTQDVSFENFIQTDAAINRGNSGGPLVNLSGEVVGIATAMNWGAENIGFAVPVSTLKTVLPQLKENGKVSRGYLGINIQNLDYDRAQAFGLDDTDGALVTSVTDDSPAKSAGIEHGDIVVAVDGRKVKSTRDLIDYVSSQPPGKTVQLDLLRNGKSLQRGVKLGERESTGSEETETGQEHGHGLSWLGLDYQTLTPNLRQNFGLPSDVSGVVVRQVAPTSPLYDEGVAPGDLVTEVNGHAVRDSDAFESAVSSAASGSYLRFYVRRFNPHSNRSEGAGFFAIVRVP